MFRSATIEFRPFLGTKFQLRAAFLVRQAFPKRDLDVGALAGGLLQQLSKFGR